MKKLLFAAFAAMMLSACGDSKKGEAADTLNTDSATVDIEEGEMEAQGLYITPDLGMMDLKGPVKSVTRTENFSDENGKPEVDGAETTKTLFSETGELKKGGDIFDIKDFKVTRDEAGRIVKAERKSGYEEIYEIKYAGERLASYSCKWIGEISGGSVVTCNYDPEGNFTGYTEEGNSDGISFTHTYQYNIKKTDDFGNWTKAVVRCTEVETVPAYEGPDETTTNTTYKVITRKIEYTE